MRKRMVLTCMTLLLAVSGSAMAGAQQEKMKMCNKEAKQKALKGDERKAFMKACLSGKTESAGETKAEPASGGKKPGK